MDIIKGYHHRRFLLSNKSYWKGNNQVILKRNYSKSNQKYDLDPKNLKHFQQKQKKIKNGMGFTSPI